MNCIKIIVPINRYGHPHKETLEVLNSLRVPVFVTSECGETDVRKKGRRYCIARRWEKSYN